MRLLSLSLHGQYKGLKNQTFSFESADDHVIAFIGLNGSGKSQLLELISECFAYLERLQRSDFKNKAHLGFSFTLEYSMAGYVNLANFERYELFGNNLNVEGGFNNPKFRIYVKGRGVEKIDVYHSEEVMQIEIKNLPLPYIVGYSSGLNENLQRAFLKNSNQLFKALRARSRYHAEKRNIELMYDKKKNDSKASYDSYIKNKEFLFSKFKRSHPYLFEIESLELPDENLSLPESTTHSSKLIYVDYDSAQFAVAFINFEEGIIFPVNANENNASSRFPFPSPISLCLEFDFTKSQIADEVVENVKSFIRLAMVGGGCVEYSGNKTSSEQFEYYGLDYLKGRITLDLVKLAEESKFSAFGTHNPTKLFERLYKVQQLGTRNINMSDRRALNADNYFGSVKKPLKVKLPLKSENLILKSDSFDSVRYEDLSDGESQLLEILAIVKLYSAENTLFLLDEPETHLNPAWRTLFHSYLINALFSKGGDAKSQILLSTHSPFMVSSLKRNNVYQFRRNEGGFINMTMAQNETYGASFDVLVKDLFELRSLISQSVIDEIREQLKQGDLHAREWIEQNLGLSAEKAYLIRKLSQ